MNKKSKSRKSWREKFENPPEGFPKVVEGPPRWEKRFGGRRILIATPLLIDELIRKVPESKLITVNQIREHLAKEFKADATCPLTTGIFLRIAAETAEEDSREGLTPITPYWRVLKADGRLNERFPGGIEAQAKRLQDEGHTIQPPKGKKPPQVKDYEKHLFVL
jgi:hypothetical protein